MLWFESLGHAVIWKEWDFSCMTISHNPNMYYFFNSTTHRVLSPTYSETNTELGIRIEMKYSLLLYRLKFFILYSFISSCHFKILPLNAAQLHTNPYLIYRLSLQYAVAISWIENPIVQSIPLFYNSPSIVVLLRHGTSEEL